MAQARSIERTLSISAKLKPCKKGSLGRALLIYDSAA